MEPGGDPGIAFGTILGPGRDPGVAFGIILVNFGDAFRIF